MELNLCSPFDCFLPFACLRGFTNFPQLTSFLPQLDSITVLKFPVKKRRQARKVVTDFTPGSTNDFASALRRGFPYWANLVPSVVRTLRAPSSSSLGGHVLRSREFARFVEYSERKTLGGVHELTSAMLSNDAKTCAEPPELEEKASGLEGMHRP